ncbi:MAG TPA: tripartite tricarboxylate transporter substrate-binding protein [Chloroflexota bacterium]
MKTSLSRRDFLKVLAAGSGGVLLAGCGGAAATPTAAPAKPAAPAATSAPAAAPAASAAAWKPTRPITMICPWAAGGGTDAVARIFGTLLEKDFGQPVNVVNRTGGSGAVGHSAGATADPDGYTLTLVTVEIAMMHWQGLTDVDYKGFTPVAQVNFDPAGVQVAANAKWNTLKEFLDDVKANPGKVKASGTGKGGIWDVARAGMLTTAGMPETAIPWVPSEGAAPGLQELIAGGVGVVTASLPEGGSLIEAKKVKALAIMADARDTGMFKDVPTLKENNINWVSGAWRGFCLPKGAKPEVVATFEAAIKKVYDSKEYKDFMTSKSYGMVWRDSKAFATFLADQDGSMGKIMKDLGLAK